MVHCKKCGGIGFQSISALRVHQWKTHPESYDNLRLAAKKIDRKAIAKAIKRRRHKALAKLEVLTNGHGPLSAAQLLAQLKEQQKLINDTVNIVGGLIAQHEANK